LPKLDLRHAYLGVPILGEHRRFLRFVKCYEFMAWRLAHDPLQRLLKLVMEALRKQGFRVGIYLDDMLFMHEDPVQLAASVKVAVDLLESLGFLTNWEKSLVT